MVTISLNSSMRSNLLSLQAIAELQNLTQNRLATGLKVNSAVDNPSAYYTAANLNNRMDDLSQIISSMTQAIQTIKNVSTVIDTGLDILTQAKSSVQSFLEKSNDGINAIVRTEKELIDAVENGEKGLIVISGKIDLSTNQGLKLKDGQKLVGAEYLKDTKYEIGIAKPSELSFNFIDADDARAITVGNNSIVSDLKLTYVSSSRQNTAVIYNTGVDTKLQNLDIDFDLQNSDKVFRGAIHNTSNAGASLYGKIDIKTSGTYAVGMFSGTVKQDKNSFVNISTSGLGAIAIRSNYYADGVTNIETTGDKAHGFYNGSLTLNGVIKIKNTGSNGTYSLYSLTVKMLNKDAAIYIENTDRNILDSTISAVIGAKISTKNGLYEAQENINNQPPVDYRTPPLGFVKIAETPVIDLTNTPSESKLRFDKTDDKDYDIENRSFVSILEQYNQLINDAEYKNVNLLNGQNLLVNFNETRTSKIDILGVDATLEGLGLSTNQWLTRSDLRASVSQIENAVQELRRFNNNFGNFYSIITNREEFTNNLINVLEEGANKLTLSDMNEESANILALETRQLLAVNSLSLAAQSAQSILRLF